MSKDIVQIEQVSGPGADPPSTPASPPYLAQLPQSISNAELAERARGSHGFTGGVPPLPAGYPEAGGSS